MRDAAGLSFDLQAKFDELRTNLASLDSALVAFSGGVDSSFLIKVAHDILGERLTALTSVSPTNPEEDSASAMALARALGVRHVVIETNELEIDGYAANPTNRCYLCKDGLYDLCAREAREHGIAAILDGVNLDDLRDYRPGLRAADEHGVRHPLVEARMTKDDLRTLSRALGLATWDRPASPCLSSRFPYGTEITLERLAMVERAEDAIRRLGFREVRVRFHGDVARVEVPASELERFADAALRAAVVAGIRAAGFRYVALDLEGFRSGSLNAGIAGAR